MTHAPTFSFSCDMTNNSTMLVLGLYPVEINFNYYVFVQICVATDCENYGEMGQTITKFRACAQK